MRWGWCKTSPQRKTKEYAPLAQLVEHLTLNQGVQGSNPWRRTKNTVFADNAIAAGTVFFMFYGKVKNKVKVGYIQALIGQNFSKDNKQEKLSNPRLDK